MIELSSFEDSWQFAWVLSWLASPLGEAKHRFIEDESFQDGTEEPSTKNDVYVCLNREPGVALIYEEGELVIKLLHPEYNG